MYNINIEELENSDSKSIDFNFEDYIEGINSVEPLKAELQIKSLGEIIEVTGQVSAKVKLECDLCLDEFVYDLNIGIHELLAKNTLLEEYGQETELKEGQFVTDLHGAQEIDIYEFLYQSVIIHLPIKNVCDTNCKGNGFLKEEEVCDPRLEIFKNIDISSKK